MRQPSHCDRACSVEGAKAADLGAADDDAQVGLAGRAKLALAALGRVQRDDMVALLDRRNPASDPRPRVGTIAGKGVRDIRFAGHPPVGPAAPFADALDDAAAFVAEDDREDALRVCVSAQPLGQGSAGPPPPLFARSLARSLTRTVAAQRVRVRVAPASPPAYRPPRVRNPARRPNSQRARCSSYTPVARILMRTSCACAPPPPHPPHAAIRSSSYGRRHRSSAAARRTLGGSTWISSMPVRRPPRRAPVSSVHAHGDRASRGRARARTYSAAASAPTPQRRGR